MKIRGKIGRIFLIIIICFIGRFLFSCDPFLDDDYNDVIGISIDSKKSHANWSTFSINTVVHTEFIHSVRVSQRWQQNLQFKNCVAASVELRYKVLENKVTNFDFIILPEKISIRDKLVTEDNQEVSDYMELLNKPHGDIGNCLPEFACSFYDYPVQFRFKKEPTDLKDKEFRIVYLLKTANGKEFADTTEVIKLAW